VNIFKLCLNNVCGIGESGWVIKHKWEQPLRVIPISSLLNHFISGVRLRLSWLAAFSSSLCLRILSIYFSTHRFRVLPFTASPSGCPFGFPCGRPSRTECYTEYNLVLFLRSVLQLYEHCRLFSFPVPWNSRRNLRLFFLLVINSTF